jgi:hypothetical protein
VALRTPSAEGTEIMEASYWIFQSQVLWHFRLEVIFKDGNLNATIDSVQGDIVALSSYFPADNLNRPRWRSSRKSEYHRSYR